jgi:hypothetical protein
MDKASYLAKFKIGNPNQDVAMADVIYQGFHKKLAFPIIMSCIKAHGREYCYQTYNSIRQQPNVKNPASLFLHVISKNKITWQK